MVFFETSAFWWLNLRERQGCESVEVERQEDVVSDYTDVIFFKTWRQWLKEKQKEEETV